MGYRWTEDGPAFEFPTPYGVENRLLKWRGWSLLVLALTLVALVAALSGAEAPNTPVAIEDRPEPASAWPLYLLALVLMVLAVLDLVRLARQRTLRLARGQPASLAQEVPHEASGVGAGTPALMQALLRGELPATPLSGPYQRLLRGMGAVTLAPQPLRTFLAARVAHLTLGVGLLLVLAVGAVLLMNKPVALPVLAAVVCLLGAFFVARQAFRPAEPPFGTIALAATLMLAVGALVPLMLFGAQLKLLEPALRLGLPAAAAVALCSGLLFEALGLVAGRAQLPHGSAMKLPREEVLIDFGADPRSLVQEIDREFYRRWTEGVPNRRYAWQPPFVDRAATVGDLGAKLLEESQPMAQAPAEDNAGQAPGPALAHNPPGAGTLKLLAVCGLVWALAGALLWLWLGYTRMRNPAAPLWPGAVGLACLAGAGYALRMGHLLWSRMELNSTLTWIELKGRFMRIPGAPQAPEKPGLQRNDKPVRCDEITLQVLVARARSVFYAAAQPGALGRTLLGWQADRAAGEFWIGFVEAFARGGDTAAAPRTPSRPARPAAMAETDAAPASRRPARFCSNCGTPVLAGARFCQQCGNVLGE